MAQAEAKTGELLLEIKSRFKVGEMSPFEFKLYLREVEKIKKIDACDGYHLEGVLRSVYDPTDAKPVLDSFQKALRLNETDAVLWLNYSVALSILNRTHDALIMSQKALSIAMSTGAPEELLTDILEVVTRTAVLTGDFMELKSVIKNFSQQYPGALGNEDLVKFFEQHGDAIDDELEQLGNVYKAVFEEYNVIPKGASQFVMPEGDCIVKLYIDTDNDTVHRMNNDAINKMIAGDIFAERFGVILAKDY